MMNNGLWKEFGMLWHLWYFQWCTDNCFEIFCSMQFSHWVMKHSKIQGKTINCVSSKISAMFIHLYEYFRNSYVFYHSFTFLSETCNFPISSLWHAPVHKILLSMLAFKSSELIEVKKLKLANQTITVVF